MNEQEDVFNANQLVSITLTRKEGGWLVQMIDYYMHNEIGDGMEWDEDEKEMIKYGNQALDKISAAL